MINRKFVQSACTQEFMETAVKFALAGGKPIVEVAGELGLPDKTLYACVRSWRIKNVKLDGTAGIVVHHKAVEGLMKKQGICAKRKKKFKATTNSKPNLPVAKNLLNHQFMAAKLNQAWDGGGLAIPCDLDRFMLLQDCWLVKVASYDGRPGCECFPHVPLSSKTAGARHSAPRLREPVRQPRLSRRTLHTWLQTKHES